MKLYRLIEAAGDWCPYRYEGETLFKWTDWHDRNPGLVVVGYDPYGAYLVSTKFVGIDHNVWETAVIREGKVVIVHTLDETHTRDDAAKQHAQITLAMMRGKEHFWLASVWQKQK